MQISFMKFIYTLFLIPFMFAMMGSLVTFSCFASTSDLVVKTDKSDVNYSNNSNQTETGNKQINDTLVSSIATTDKNKGVLIVKVTTINGDEGMNNSSDFIVNVHANNPVPATFKGNLTGTIVELSMGMYSITISSIPSYNTSLSSDCAGGIMKVETAYCNIVNTYIKS